ncbi:MAG: polyketide cyclase [Rhodococcus sp. (in: high G+C Gram-positive bacteria)]
MSIDRFDVHRVMALQASDIFAVLCDPQGHVAIDGSGMLMSADGAPVRAVGDSFVVHMDREALGDLPMGTYDVEVTIATLTVDREISWTILGTVRPPIGHRYGYLLEPHTFDDGTEGTTVTSFYDWSNIREDLRGSDLFPVVSEAALKATLGILERTVRRGYAGDGRVSALS